MVFKHLYWNSSTFKSLILLLSFSSTFKDFKHLYEPWIWENEKLIFSETRNVIELKLNKNNH